MSRCHATHRAASRGGKGTPSRQWRPSSCRAVGSLPHICTQQITVTCHDLPPNQTEPKQQNKCPQACKAHAASHPNIHSSTIAKPYHMVRKGKTHRCYRTHMRQQHTFLVCLPPVPLLTSNKCEGTSRQSTPHRVAERSAGDSSGGGGGVDCGCCDGCCTRGAAPACTNCGGGCDSCDGCGSCDGCDDCDGCGSSASTWCSACPSSCSSALMKKGWARRRRSRHAPGTSEPGCSAALQPPTAAPAAGPCWLPLRLISAGPLSPLKGLLWPQVAGVGRWRESPVLVRC